MCEHTENDNVRKKEVANGQLIVTELGDVYRVDGDKVTLVNPHITRGKYLVVYLYQNGKQIHYYVHRLVAEAFIPKPPNASDIVRAYDGDFCNARVDNLFWVVPQPKATMSVPCTQCGKPTTSRRHLCAACNRKQKAANELGNLDLSSLTARQREYIQYRLDGKTFREIGEICDVSYQAVKHLILHAVNRNEQSAVKALRKQLKCLDRELVHKKELEESLSQELYSVRQSIQQLQDKLNILNSNAEE